jgi:hypothetical protein
MVHARLARRDGPPALHKLARRRVVLLDGVAARRAAIRAEVLILVALGRTSSRRLRTFTARLHLGQASRLASKRLNAGR